MKKLNVAIIGQGRSGRGIHGKYFLSEDNKYYNVKYVVDLEARRRAFAEKDFEGCKTFATHQELYGIKDIDLVVNAAFSDLHYSITLDLLQHGFNVLVEKPFARTKYECDHLIKTAKENNVTLAVYQQSFYAPYYIFAKKLVADGVIGDIKCVNIRFNSFARRWDWQTLQKRCAGGLYNTGPHPIGFALGFLDFDKNATVAYSKLDMGLTSGDSDDFAKVILTAPGKPVVDVEVSSLDSFSPFSIKLQGSRGTCICTPGNYKLCYIVDGENPEHKAVEGPLMDETGAPIWCSENLKKHEEENTFSGNAFDVGAASFYEQLYYKITEGRPMDVTPEMAADIIRVISTAYAQNPLDVRF